MHMIEEKCHGGTQWWQGRGVWSGGRKGMARKEAPTLEGKLRVENVIFTDARFCYERRTSGGVEVKEPEVTSATM